MSEVTGKNLLIEPSPPIEEHLWPVFVGLERQLPETFSLLKPNKEVIEAAKESFFASSRQKNPDLRPTKVNEEELQNQETRLLEFKNLLKSDKNTDLLAIHAYLWRVNEALANIQMLKAGVAGDMRRFNAYNQFIYGQPDPEVFAAAVDGFRAQAEEFLQSEHAEVRQAAEVVLDLVPNQGGDRNLLVPDPEVFAAVREHHFRQGGYYALLLAGVNLPDQDKVPNEIGDPAIRQVLQNIGSDLDILDADGSTWSLDRQAGGVRRPVSYNMILKRFIGLPLGHEVGSHELEYQNGIRQALRLFASGLDRTENGNEGRALIREQVVYPSFEEFSKIVRWQDVTRRFFAVAVAEGLAAHGKKPEFYQAFNIINAVDRLWERSKKPEDIAAADEKADKRSWDLLAERIYRGTDGTGGSYRKDMVYLPSNIANWKLAALSPELISQGDLGKFDITNPRHISIAQAFGVLPQAE